MSVMPKILHVMQRQQYFVYLPTCLLICKGILVCFLWDYQRSHIATKCLSAPYDEGEEVGVSFSDVHIYYIARQLAHSSRWGLQEAAA